MQGAVHKIRRQWRGGRDQKFVNIYQQIGVKNCRHGGGVCQKFRNNQTSFMDGPQAIKDDNLQNAFLIERRQQKSS